jgi:microcystin-dependent protein
MSDNYIGSGKEIVILPNNLREDLVPDGSDGPSPAAVAAGDAGPVGSGTTQFSLTTEVPGGVEHQIRVIKRKFELCELLKDTTNVDIDGVANKITSADSTASDQLSHFKVGQKIIIKGASNAQNNNDFTISSIDYDADAGTIEIFVAQSLITEAGSTLTITQGFDGLWELLEPEIDYSIDLEVGPDTYTLLNLAEGLYEEDFVYILHISSATYGFVPSTGSVGPSQLQENLRNFVVDRFTADGIQDVFTLSQDAVNSSTLEVYVDGVWIEGRNEGQVIADSEWELAAAGDEITFDSPPANTSRVIIKHLGFSTISRRAALSQGQIGAPPPGSVSTGELANGAVTSSKLASGAVTSTKIGTDAITHEKVADNAIQGDEFRLNNNEFLRARDVSDLADLNLLKVNASDETVLNSPNDLISAIAEAVILRLQTGALLPETDNAVDLGSLTKRFKDVFVNNADIVTDLTVGGDITITGTIDNTDVSDLQDRVAELELIANAPGQMKLWAADTDPDPLNPVGSKEWLKCDGTQYNIATYSDLYAVIGNLYNTTGDGISTFNVPDFRGRFPLGKAASGTGSGFGHAAGRGGSLDHTHTVSSHTHDIAHTHTIPGHYHAYDLGLNSSLSIASSGGHTTSIAHNHASVTSGNQNGTVYTSYNGGHTPTGSITGSGAHSHTLQVRQRTNGGGGTATRRHPNTTDVIDLQPVIGDGSHSHSFSGDSVADHRHTVNNHTHNVDIPSFPSGSDSPASGNSSSSGNHIHSSSNFSGSVGNVSGGFNGNSNLTTNSQSTTTSGSGGGGNTGSTNPAFQTTNIIIKT